MNELGERLKALRTSRGWSQETLAARAHISLRTVARLEAGGDGQIPKRSTIVLLALALKVSVEYLEDGDTNGDEAVA